MKPREKLQLDYHMRRLEFISDFGGRQQRIYERRVRVGLSSARMGMSDRFAASRVGVRTVIDVLVLQPVGHGLDCVIDIVQQRRGAGQGQGEQVENGKRRGGESHGARLSGPAAG